MMESPMITASRSVSRREAKRLQVEISKTRGGEVVARGLDRFFRFFQPVQRNTRTRGGGSVSSVLHTYTELVSVSPGCFQHCSPFPQLGLLPKQLVDPSLHGLRSICTERSSNASSPALKGRHRSTIKASSSEKMVMCVNIVNVTQ